MDPTLEDWQRLGLIVRRRRISLGLTQQDVRAAGGPSTATMRLLEGGLQDTYSPMVIGRLEKVLKWEGGSVEAILARGEPTELRQSGPTTEATEAADREEGGDLEQRYNFKERFERIRRQLDEEKDERAAKQLDTALRIIEGGAG